MTNTELTIEQLVSMRNALMVTQNDLYIAAITNINMRYRELLKKDFGSQLAKNCLWDAADTVINNYFPLSEYHISTQQMYDRFINFSYDDTHDILLNNSEIRRSMYYARLSSNEANALFEASIEAGKNVFSEERSKDSLERETVRYRENRTKAGTLRDDITKKKGQTSKVYRNGKEYQVSNLHADHVQARDSVKYDTRYIEKNRLQDMREFYYSDKNFWLIHGSANTSKGAVRVCQDKESIVFLSDKEFKDKVKRGIMSETQDITWKASPIQLAEATIQMWEKETPSGSKIAALMEAGYLDEFGKVTPEAKKELISVYEKSINQESLHMILPYYKVNEAGQKELVEPWLDYSSVAKDAWNMTSNSITKIIAGQAIYYVLPPLVFETKLLLRQKDMTLERFFKEIRKSGKRIIKYVSSKLGEILRNIVGNSVVRFIKSFFNIILEATRSTVRKLLRIIKDVVIALVNCIKTATSRKSTAVEKADAVTKTLGITITTVVLEVLFEWAEKQFGLPDILMEPLQIIVTILATNLVMLILQEMDLFDVQYGLLVSNMERVFADEYQQYLQQSYTLLHTSKVEMQNYLENLNAQIHNIEKSIDKLNFYEDDVTEDLNRINNIYNMGIDFNKEWQDFLAV